MVGVPDQNVQHGILSAALFHPMGATESFSIKFAVRRSQRVRVCFEIALIQSP
jgi:hypothetical protein